MRHGGRPNRRLLRDVRHGRERPPLAREFRTNAPDLGQPQPRLPAVERDGRAFVRASAGTRALFREPGVLARGAPQGHSGHQQHEPAKCSTREAPFPFATEPLSLCSNPKSGMRAPVPTAQQARQFCEAASAMSDSKRLAAARKLHRRFVTDDADDMINLPFQIQQKITTEITAAQSGGAAIRSAVFEEAEQEIFRLMERDTYARFRSDPAALGELIESFFTEIHGSKPDKPELVVEYDEYKAWVLKHPQALAFFSSLPVALRKLVRTEGGGRRASNASAVTVDPAEVSC
mmetsp:Transcript_53874/g.148540  ORF Transcript_53874/g.148540 Transcript_53874/m.148540 type:complete len:290 (+) Transcript_53874:562-1431(+)